MKIFRKLVLVLAVLGIVDTVFVLAISGGTHVGTVLPGVAGGALAAWLLLTRYLGADFLLSRYPHVRRLCLVLLVLLGISFVVVQVLICSQAGGEAVSGTDWYILLGAGVRGEIPSPTLQRRLDAAVDILSRYTGARVVVSGGRGIHETITEAECMRRYLVQEGIDEARIFLEDKATSTLENLRFSMDLISRVGGKPGETVSVITSDFHLSRTRMLASRLGFEIRLVSTSTPWYLLPNTCLREYFALVKSLLLDH